MNNTMGLLEKALVIQNGTQWAKELGIAKNTLYTAKDRGHLSPSIAGAIAERLGYDAMKWIALAALESEKENNCKARMVRKYGSVVML